MVENKNEKKVTVDSRTGMVMRVETADGILDFTACSKPGYEGPNWDFD